MNNFEHFTPIKGCIVGGSFDKNGGKKSSIVDQFAEALNWPMFNGGYISDIPKILHKINEVEVVIWMPLIDNEEDKVLPSIKQMYPKLLLIQSKRSIETYYTDGDIIGRLLASHSNFGIKITKEYNFRKEREYTFKLLDPLGNQWAYTSSVDELANALKTRIYQLMNLKRISSTCVGTRHEFTIDSKFIQIVRNYGIELTHHVNAVNPNRLLGNASTRCAKGFPAIRGQGGSLYVTRRNVDKTTLNENDFVEVQNVEFQVRYYGNHKPSVDTPVQIRLFNFYKNVNYILHGHAYIKDGLMTEHKIPCGYLEETNDIMKIIPNLTAFNFVINLKGHGFLIMAKDLDYFSKHTLVSRPFPEE